MDHLGATTLLEIGNNQLHGKEPIMVRIFITRPHARVALTSMFIFTIKNCATFQRQSGNHARITNCSASSQRLHGGLYMMPNEVALLQNGCSTKRVRRTC